MLRWPAFKPHLRIEVVPGEGVFVLSETHQTILQGRLYERVAACLDGRPVEDLLAALRTEATPAQVVYTLKKLDDNGFLQDGAPCAPAGAAAWWSLQGVAPAEVAARLAETPAAVEGLGVETGPFRALLAALGVRLDGTAGFGVVLADHYLRGELRAYNRAALASGRPWLLVKPLGAQIWIGPLFRPGRAACWDCLAMRMRANLPVVSYLERLLNGRGLPPLAAAQSEASLAAALGLAAQAVQTCLVQGLDYPLLESNIRSLDLFTLEGRTHTLIRQPHCPACGTFAAPADVNAGGRSIRIQSRKIAYAEDGGHRTCHPRQTLETYGHHVSPICGTVTMLEPANASDRDVMPVFVSGHNITRVPKHLGSLRFDLRNSNCGKGTNELQAKAGALCEALERTSCIFRGDEPRRTASLAELGDTAIHPNACMLFSERQYQEREERNSHASITSFIPRPFCLDRAVEWTPVWSLTHEAVRYLPTGYCYFDYPQTCQSHWFVSCSNGCAAGNDLEEAVLQGFLELVERDAVGLWWYSRARVPGVRLQSFGEAYFDTLATTLAKHHRDLWALDLTSDLGIPVFAALSRRTDGPVEQIMFGFGAHLEPRIALLRAVTELNQMLSHILTAPPDGPAGDLDDEETVRWLRTATLAEHPYLVALEGQSRGISDYAMTWTDDLAENIRQCRRRVEELGHEVLVLDMTRPEIGLPVARVIVPGLRHFWARFAPGRLYDVPARLGWTARPLAEDALNPISIFI